MKTIYSEKLPRILKSKKKLEEVLKVKITNRGKEVSIEGTPENEFVAEKVLDAINFGFPVSSALTIKKEDFMLEILKIKNYTTRADMESIRARIIGRGGKTLKTLCSLTKCFLELKDNEIGIIGPPDLIKNAQEAITSLIRGSKQGNVYNFLEKHQEKPILDLGLKE